MLKLALFWQQNLLAIGLLSGIHVAVDAVELTVVVAHECDHVALMPEVLYSLAHIRIHSSCGSVVDFLPKCIFVVESKACRFTVFPRTWKTKNAWHQLDMLSTCEKRVTWCLVVYCTFREVFRHLPFHEKKGLTRHHFIRDRVKWWIKWSCARVAYECVDVCDRILHVTC